MWITIDFCLSQCKSAYREARKMQFAVNSVAIWSDPKCCAHKKNSGKLHHFKTRLIFFGVTTPTPAENRLSYGDFFLLLSTEKFRSSILHLTCCCCWERWWWYWRVIWWRWLKMPSLKLDEFGIRDEGEVKWWKYFCWFESWQCWQKW